MDYQSKYVRKLLERDYTELARGLSDELQSEFSYYLARQFYKYRFSKSYSKETYLMAAILLGTRFDEDLIYSEGRKILEADAPCYLRMAHLKSEIFAQRDNVYGARYENYARALKRVIAKEERHIFDREQQSEHATIMILRLFPEKANILSKMQIEKLVDKSNTISRNYFPNDMYLSGAIVIFCHMFLLGTGCVDDPLHDYVRRILHSDDPDKARILFRYGQKRAKAQLRAFEKFVKQEKENKYV